MVNTILLTLFRDGLAALFRALVLGDELSFGQEHLAEGFQHVEQQIQFPQTLATRAPGPEKEFKLNPAATIGDGDHVVSPLVLTTMTRFAFSEYVGRMAGRY